jgi:uncharacterized membrane protein YphA (DoxX/SURF4 family)
MDIISDIIQLIIALGIFNVWLLRPKLSTSFRGGESKSLKDEFKAYGLPEWAFYTVGTLKLTAAVLLLVGLIVPVVILPGAGLMAVLMLGAVAMHAKVGDPAIRYLPAAVMLVMSLFLLIG